MPKIFSLLAFISGALITFSLAPFSISPLAIVALVGLHWLLSNTTTKQGIYISLSFGFGLMLTGAHWLYVSMHDHGGTPMLLAVIFTTSFCFWIGSWLLPFTLFYQRFCRHGVFAQSVGFAALYVLSEWMRTWFLTGFPWLFIGYSQTQAWLASFAPITGVFGISFILAVTAAVISLVIQKRCHIVYLLLPISIWALAYPLQFIHWTEKMADKPALHVAMVQGNIALEDKWKTEFKQPMMDYYLSQIQQFADNDLIILPETAITEYLHRANDWFDAVDAVLLPKQNALVTGIPSAELTADQNIAIFNSLATAGYAFGYYNKQKLVPFGEFIPFEKQLNQILDLFDIPMSSFSAGDSNQPHLVVKGLAAQGYICYEMMYPDFVANTAIGTAVLITVSNDAWFGHSIGPIQHLQMAQMRALETGRYLLRATNNGQTAIIDNKGQITQQIPRFQRGVLVGEFYAMQGLTPFMRYGTLPMILFSLIILTLLYFQSQKRYP